MARRHLVWHKNSCVHTYGVLFLPIHSPYDFLNSCSLYRLSLARMLDLEDVLTSLSACLSSLLRCVLVLMLELLCNETHLDRIV